MHPPSLSLTDTHTRFIFLFPSKWKVHLYFFFSSIFNEGASLKKKKNSHKSFTSVDPHQFCCLGPTTWVYIYITHRYETLSVLTFPTESEKYWTCVTTFRRPESLLEIFPLIKGYYLLKKSENLTSQVQNVSHSGWWPVPPSWRRQSSTTSSKVFLWIIQFKTLRGQRGPPLITEGRWACV